MNYEHLVGKMVLLRHKHKHPILCGFVRDVVINSIHGSYLIVNLSKERNKTGDWYVYFDNIISVKELVVKEGAE